MICCGGKLRERVRMLMGALRLLWFAGNDEGRRDCFGRPRRARNDRRRIIQKINKTKGGDSR